MPYCNFQIIFISDIFPALVLFLHGDLFRYAMAQM